MGNGSIGRRASASLLILIAHLSARRACTGTGAATAALGDLQADERLLKFGGDAGEVDVRLAALELLLRAAAGFLRTGDVDLLSALGGVSEDGHAIVADFEEATGDGHVGLVVAALDAHDAALETARVVVVAEADGLGAVLELEQLD